MCARKSPTAPPLNKKRFRMLSMRYKVPKNIGYMCASNSFKVELKLCLFCHLCQFLWFLTFSFHIGINSYHFDAQFCPLNLSSSYASAEGCVVRGTLSSKRTTCALSAAVRSPQSPMRTQSVQRGFASQLRSQLGGPSSCPHCCAAAQTVCVPRTPSVR